MSTADHADPVYDASPDRLAATVREAEFLHVIARADGDAIGAAALLTTACAALETPFHISTVRTRSELDDRIHASDPSAALLVLGASRPGDPSPVSVSTSERAHAAVQSLGPDPDPILSLAGILAGDTLPRDLPDTILDRADLPQRPGVAIPTTDLVDGLAHSTLVHTDYSANPDHVQAALDQLVSPRDDAQFGTQVASLLAIAVTASDPSDTPRAATAIERAVNPHVVPGQFETLGGYADVLGALSVTHPGLAIALATGHTSTEHALEHWRIHATHAHTAIRTATTDHRTDNLLIAQVTDGPVETVARLLRDFATAADTVIAATDTTLGVATAESPISLPIERAAAAVNGSGLTHNTTGYAAIPPDRLDAFLTHL